MRARAADDLIVLQTLANDPLVAARLNSPGDVRLLWDVCCIPDFRGISPGEHANLLMTIFNHLKEGPLPEDWLLRQIKRLDQTQGGTGSDAGGDIDGLSKKLSFIRTWTYVSQRKNWTKDEKHWRGVARAVEDRLSDALHNALTQRFVDRRTSVLMRRLKQKESLVADVNDKGEVTVEGQFAGRLEGFRFTLDKSAEGDEAKTLKTAAYQALAPEFSLRSDRFYNAPDTEIDFTEQGGLMWGEYAVGKLVKGDEALKPRVQAFVDDEAGTDVSEKVTRRLQHFIDRKIANLFEPMLAMSRDETLTGIARGFAFRLLEAQGILPRDQIAQEVKELDQDARGMLRKHGVRFGQFTIFMPLLLKPAPTRLRLVLWGLFQDHAEFAESPPPGLVTIPSAKDLAAGYHNMCGYRQAGERAIRIDMLERLADMLRSEDSRGGFEANADMLSISGMTLVQFADLMRGLGYKAEEGERAKVKAAPAEAAKVEAPVVETPVAEAEAAVVEEAPAVEDAPVEEATSEEAAPEMEVFFTFTWARQQRNAGNRGNNRGDAEAGQNRNRGNKPKAGGRNTGKPGRKGGNDRDDRGDQKPKSWASKPARKEKPIDPDNPFAAALMGLKSK